MPTLHNNFSCYWGGDKFSIYCLHQLSAFTNDVLGFYTVQCNLFLPVFQRNILTPPPIFRVTGWGGCVHLNQVPINPKHHCLCNIHRKNLRTWYQPFIITGEASLTVCCDPGTWIITGNCTRLRSNWMICILHWLDVAYNSLVILYSNCPWLVTWYKYHKECGLTNFSLCCA